MAKARKRYYAKGNIRINDVKLEGQELMFMAECNWAGDTKRPNGKPLLKKEKTHVKLRFSDKKWLKDNALTKFLDRIVEKKYLPVFYIEEGQELDISKGV